MSKSLSPAPKFQAIDPNGNPYALGKLYTYIANSSTPAATYSDAGGTLNTNPIILDTAGRANIWLTDNVVYKFILNTALDTLVWTVDNIPGRDIDASDLTVIATGSGTAISLADRAAWIKDIRDFGAVCDGNTDDTLAVIACLNSFPATGGTMQYSGTPLISSTLTISLKILLQAIGGSGPGTANPASYFLKKSTMTTVGIKLTSAYASMRGGGVVSQAGATGGGIQVFAGGQSFDNVVSKTTSAVNDDPWLMGDRAGTTNVDGFRLTGCSALGGYNGFVVDGDNGKLDHCLANGNAANGVNIRTGANSNVLVNMVTASNTGFGININANANNNVIVGGVRNESNKIQVASTATGTQFFGVVSTEITDLNAGTGVSTVRAERTVAARNTWTPAFAGSTTPGTQTYSTQVGYWQRFGDFVCVQGSLVMTAKDGTTAGLLRITGLPFALPSGLTSAAACAAIGTFGNIDLDAGYSFVGAGLEAGNTYLRLTQAGDNIAVDDLDAANLQATSRIVFSLTYPVALV